MRESAAACGLARRRRVAVALGLWALLVPAALWGQELLTAADIVQLPSPPPDHRVAYGEDPLQFGRLRLPSGPGPHRVVVFVHGGCWLSQFDIAHAGPLEEAIAAAGYAVWSIEYRRAGDAGGGWPNTFVDVGRGADYLRVLAPEHDLDLTRVIASGHSAGGQLALWLAAREQLPANSQVYAEDPLEFHGVLALAPAPDLEAIHASGACGNVIDRLMGGSPDAHPERYRHASPMHLTPVDLPQVLIIGQHDRAWGPGGRTYHRHAVAAGAQHVTLVEATESGHFEMIVPSTSSWTLVVDSLRALFESIQP